MKNIIEIKNLSKQYGTESALDNFSLSIAKGEIFGLLGPNGSGKSTTINIIIDLISITSGSVKIFGEDIQNKEYKENIGAVPEILGLFEQLKGIEQIYFIGKIYGLNKNTIKTRSDELFSFFNLKNAKGQMINTYSTGMKKKLALMCALIHNPDLLILDEPFEGMDPVATKKTKQLFRDLKEQGKTILITSHILGYLENLCDKVAIINKGKLVYQNTMENVKTEFKNKVNKDESLSALEEIFLDVVGEDENSKQTLSWVKNDKKS